MNGNEGFVVGSSADLQYIEWGGDVGENEPQGACERRAGHRRQIATQARAVGRTAAGGPASFRRQVLWQAAVPAEELCLTIRSGQTK